MAQKILAPTSGLSRVQSLELLLYLTASQDKWDV